MTCENNGQNWITAGSSGTVEPAEEQRTFGNSTGILVESGDEGDVAGPGLSGRAGVADTPPALLLDHPAQERRPVPPPLVRLEELVRPEPVRCTHQNPQSQIRNPAHGDWTLRSMRRDRRIRGRAPTRRTRRLAGAAERRGGTGSMPCTMGDLK